MAYDAIFSYLAIYVAVVSEQGWPSLWHCSCGNIMPGTPWNNKLEKLGYLSFMQRWTAWPFVAMVVWQDWPCLWQCLCANFLVTPIKYINDDKISEVWRGQIRGRSGLILTGFQFCFWLNTKLDQSVRLLSNIWLFDQMMREKIGSWFTWNCNTVSN